MITKFNLNLNNTASYDVVHPPLKKVSVYYYKLFSFKFPNLSLPLAMLSVFYLRIAKYWLELAYKYNYYD